MELFRYVDGGPFVVGTLAAAVGVGVGLLVLRRDGLVAALHVGAVCLLVGWAAALLVLTGLPVTWGNTPGDFNLVPGRGIAAEWRNINRSLGIINIFGNVALFVPGGLLLAWLLRGRVVVCLAHLALGSAAIECLQYVGGMRAADIDDVILNSVGALVGALVGLAAARYVPAGQQPVGSSSVGDEISTR